MAQFLTIKILFMTFFSVQYVSPTFKAGLYDTASFMTKCAYYILTVPHCPKLILQYLILMLVFFIIISKKGNIFLKTMKIELSKLAMVYKPIGLIFWNTLIFEAVCHSCCKKGLSSSDKSRSKAKVSLLMLLWLNLFLNKL